MRELRNNMELSQENFAGRCGLHRTYIGSIERGEKSITIDTAQKLAQAFGISLTELFQKLEATSETELAEPPKGTDSC